MPAPLHTDPISRLKEARLLSGISLGFVVKQTGLNIDYLNGLERGDYAPTASDLERLNKIYGVNPDWLAGKNLEPVVTLAIERELEKIKPDANKRAILDYLIRVGGIETVEAPEGVIMEKMTARPAVIEKWFKQIGDRGVRKHGGKITGEVIVFNAPPNAPDRLVVLGKSESGEEWAEGSLATL